MLVHITAFVWQIIIVDWQMIIKYFLDTAVNDELEF